VVAASALNALQHAFAQPLALVLLGVLPVLALIGWLARRRQRRALLLLGRLPSPAAISSVHPLLRWLRGTCRTTGLMLLVLAVAGPQWGREPEEATMPGRDLVVVLDVSRSMLADDVLGRTSPNRLGRAQDALADLIDTVQRRGGHRVALVVFAARPRLACPLTHDYDHFRDALAQLDADDPRIGPGGNPEEQVSGTRIGAALRMAVNVDDPAAGDLADRRFLDVLLLSDGDDPVTDADWEKGVAAARLARVPVYPVGIGDPIQGGRIPFRNGYLQYEGQVVWTRLQEKPLEEIARRTGGLYIPARTQEVALGRLFLERIEPKSQREDDADAVPRYQQHYAEFLGPALLLLVADTGLGWVRRRRPAVKRGLVMEGQA
jgi:Ca-activated chloride channel family protein